MRLSLGLSAGVWLLLTSLGSLQQVNAQFVQLTGQIEVTDWNPRTVYSFTTQIHCVVGTNCWEIDGDFISNGWRAFWFSGTNLVESTVVTKNTPQEFINRLNQFLAAEPAPIGTWNNRVMASADGNPGQPAGQPDQMTEVARIAWLAFCSGPCLKQQERVIYPPSDLWKELVRTTRFAERTVPFQDPLGLPKTLDLSLADTQPVLQYRILNSTNVLGWNIPLEFAMVQYRPAPVPQSRWITTGTNGWQVEFTAKGLIKSLGLQTNLAIPVEPGNSVNR